MRHKFNSFRKNIKRIRAIINDQPESPLERALWWTEHVLRHGGNHLRAPSANTTWSEHLMLDIVLPVLSAFAVLGLLLIYACFKILNLLKYKSEKVKLHSYPHTHCFTQMSVCTKGFHTSINYSK